MFEIKVQKIKAFDRTGFTANLKGGKSTRVSEETFSAGIFAFGRTQLQPVLPVEESRKIFEGKKAHLMSLPCASDDSFSFLV